MHPTSNPVLVSECASDGAQTLTKTVFRWVGRRSGGGWLPGVRVHGPPRTILPVCDTLVALGSATADGVALFAKNSDRPPSEVQVLEWSSSRVDRSPLRATYVDVPAHPKATIAAVISRPTWGWGAEHGVNVAGVAIGNEAIYTTLDPRDSSPALTGMDLVRLGLERGATAEDAVEVIVTLIEQHGQGGSGHHGRSKPYWSSFLVADPGDAWVVETSGKAWATERVDEVRAITNRTTIPGFDEVHRHPRQPVEVTTDPRWSRSRRILAERPVTVDALAQHLANHDDGPWSVCMHVAPPDVAAGHDEATTASMIAALPAGGPPTVWTAQGPPCRTPYVRSTVPP